MFYTTSNGTFNASCPAGYNLLSCGFFDIIKGSPEPFRSAIPIDNKTCQCFDNSSVSCSAWCTTAPILGFEIKTASGSGTFSAACSPGKRVLGCHIRPTAASADWYRQFYPVPSGESCTCNDTYGAECVATCGTVSDYEVRSTWGVWGVLISCSNPGTRVLGCGRNPSGASNYELFSVSRVINDTTCNCVQYYGTNCYAACGNL